MRFFDASALVKRYISEPGSAAVGRLLVSGPAAVSRLSEVEIASALARRTRQGHFTRVQRDRTVAALVRDLPALVVVEMTSEITAEARGLLRRLPLRTADAIQLASALYLQRRLGREVTFVAFDQRLGDAAREEALLTSLA
jgi:predicted nucleic acid-binding protein